MKTKSPLRYVGGKTRAVEMIMRCFPVNSKTMCSPFLGGGSIELQAAANGVEVVAYDAFEPLVNFWQVLLSRKEDLVSEVSRLFPLSRSTFYELQKQLPAAPVERAAAYFALNRASFHGGTLSAGMSPGHPRFNLASIQRLADFSAPNLHVERGDFSESLARHPDLFTYLDPPYMLKNSTLYGYRGDAHRNFDHEALWEILQERQQWIVSYNDCAQVREMYRAYRIIPLTWKYGMSQKKLGKEILVLSPDIELPATGQNQASVLELTTQTPWRLAA